MGANGCFDSVLLLVYVGTCVGAEVCGRVGCMGEGCMGE